MKKKLKGINKMEVDVDRSRKKKCLNYWKFTS